MDTFICGTCQGAFNDIDVFMQHKQKGCTRPPPEIIQVHVDGSGEVTEVTGADNIMETDSGSSAATLAFLNEMSAEGRLATVENEDGDMSTQTFIILNDPGDLVTSEPSTLGTVDSGTSTIGLGEELDSKEGILSAFRGSAPDNSSQGQPHKPARRIGRPRKGEEKKKTIEAVPASETKPDVPETGADGTLRCIRCHRTFRKERHYKTHKCLATSAYVDITKKEVKIDSGDEEEPEEGEAGAMDEGEEYHLPEESTQAEEESQDEEFTTVTATKTSSRPGRQFQLHVEDDAEQEGKERATGTIEDLPIFRTEDEKLEFEATVNVDLSCVDHMFKVHVIDQDVNEHAGTYGRSQLSSLSLYSCTVCEKVFKTLSHMRLHCLVHTNLKPFRCSKCSYATNSKGNLYTHMRKHTGQFYVCKHCEFRTVNKSHLVEHEATHDKTRHPCAMCQRDYATNKSLVNHVRKYHGSSRRGRQYLQTFLQGRQTRGSTVIHQCHVCMRKFKKRIDRDRHLFVHDIRDSSTVQQCDLCDYSTSRRVYLEKHYTKHRVLYCCAACPEKFLSTIRLLEHLQTAHMEDGAEAGGCEELFERSINCSLYLPEPDEQLPATEKQFINLPPELSATAITSSASTLSASDTVTDSMSATAADNLMAGRKVDADILGGQEVGEGLTTVDDMLAKPAPMDVSEVAGNDESVSVQQGQASEAPEGAKPCEAQMTDAQTSDDTQMIDATQMTDAQVPVSTEEKQADISAPAPVPVIKVTCSAAGTTVHMEGLVNSIASEAPSTSQADENTSVIMTTAVNPSESITDMSLTPNPEENVTDVTLTSDPIRDSAEVPLAPDGARGTAAESLALNSMADVPLAPNPGTDDLNPGIEIEGADAELLAQEEEQGEASIVKQEDGGKGQSIIDKMGYQPMNMQILHKMRDTFGSEECEFCGRLFYSKQDYEPHLRTHTGDKPFLCTQCGFRAITRENLRRHVEREHENIKFPCKDCDFVAASRTKLWNHQLQHLGISGLDCPQCPEKFENLKQMRAHLVTNHPDINRDELEKLTGYKHKTQGKMGRRSYKCPHCDRVFIRANSELQKHIWIHEGIKPFKCSLCTYACRSKNNLAAHMLRHSNHKPFACQECGKAYKSKTALRWHVRSHKDGKLFKCDKCPYEAQQRSHLKRHMETHEVVKRFVCQHCDYSANTAGYMKIHYARTHKGVQYMPELQTVAAEGGAQGSEARVFKCLSCDYLFGNLSDLKRHLRIRHRVQVQDIAGIEQMQVAEVEVLQCAEEMPTTETQDVVEPNSVLAPSMTHTVGGTELDEKTASAVTLLQQIIDMQQQGAFGQQEIKVMSEDGQMVSVNPETIIVQQAGHQVLVTNGEEGSEGQGQYVIQYVAPSDDPTGDPSMEGVPMEIQTVDAVESVAVVQE